MEKILISACLTGTCCKYNGGHNKLPAETLLDLKKRVELIPVCPEQLGGLPTPRIPAERRADGVFTRDGRDVTDYFEAGAKRTLQIAENNSVKRAVLKAGSPSCGWHGIYDGSFTGKKTEGNGITADLLHRHGIRILTEAELDHILH